MDAATAQTAQPRILTAAELADVVRLLREERTWSQEQLAEIAGISARTVQRVEEGQPSSLDSRRALAIAFGAEDIDAFNKPHVIPTAAQRAAEKERFEKEHVTLQAVRLESGKQLANLIEHARASLYSEAANLPPDGEEVYARLADYCREYTDSAEFYSAVDKLALHAELDEMVAALRDQGFSLVGAAREANVAVPGSSSELKFRLVYVVACPKGQEPPTMVVPRAVQFR